MIDQRKIKTELIINSIVDILKKGERNIAQLCSEASIKRSTLIHYLNLMEIRGLIDKERIEEKSRGRPTIIRLKKETLQKMKEQEQDVLKLDKEILAFIEENPTTTEMEIYNTFKSPQRNIAMVIAALTSLEEFDYLQRVYKLTSKGKEFSPEKEKLRAARIDKISEDIGLS